MKKTFITICVLIIVSLVVTISCNKEAKSPPDKIDQPVQTEFTEKFKLMEDIDIPYLKSTNGELIYSGTLCQGDLIVATAIQKQFNNPDGWTYYNFYGYAGQEVDINLVRVTCEMDPSYSLYFGTSNTTEGLDALGSTNPDLEFITFRDDQVPRPEYCEGFCFSYGDPSTDVTLPHTGWYTLGVYDFISCEDPPELIYNLSVEGIAFCTIIIDGCDTELPNQLIGDVYMQEMIDECAMNAKNHGKFVSCVSHLTNDWKVEGYITGEEKGIIMACAANSNIPY